MERSLRQRKARYYTYTLILAKCYLILNTVAESISVNLEIKAEKNLYDL